MPLRDGAYDLEALAGAVTDATRLVYVCSPNNPTGGVVRGPDLAAFLDRVPERVLVVIDSAYHEYVIEATSGSTPWQSMADAPTSSCCAPSRRSTAWPACGWGMACAPAGVVRELAKVRGPFDVSEAAHAAAAASLGDGAELERRREQNRLERLRLEQQLAARGVRLYPAAANFVCAEVGDGASLAARLEREGVIVRPLAPFGAPDVRADHGRAAGGERRAADGARPGAAAGMSGRRDFDLPALEAGVLAGEKRAVARAITLVENRDEGAYELVKDLYPHTGGAVVAGLHRPARRRQVEPVAALVAAPARRGAERWGGVGRPLQPVHEGAVLGDRIRLTDHFLDPGVFIRSMSTARPPGRDLRVDAAGAAGAGRVRQGRAAAGDGRRRAERGRGGHRSPTRSCWC